MAGLFLFGLLLGVLTEPLAVLLSRSYMRVVSVALALTLFSSGFVCAQQSTVTQQQLLARQPDEPRQRLRERDDMLPGTGSNFDVRSWHLADIGSDAEHVR